MSFSHDYSMREENYLHYLIRVRVIIDETTLLESAGHSGSVFRGPNHSWTILHHSCLHLDPRD